MERKNAWEDYTSEEKTNLLNHWFHYYGGMLMTFDDFEKFHELASTKQDDLFDHIVTLFIARETIQSNLLIHCIRENEVDKLFKNSIKREKVDPQLKDLYEGYRNDVFNEIITTFLNPEPPIPLDIAIMVKKKHFHKKTNNGKRNKD